MVSSRGHVINGQFLIALSLSPPLGSLYYQRLTAQSIEGEEGEGALVQSSIINNFVGQVSAIRSALSTCSFFSLKKLQKRCRSFHVNDV